MAAQANRLTGSITRYTTVIRGRSTIAIALTAGAVALASCHNNDVPTATRLRSASPSLASPPALFGVRAPRVLDDEFEALAKSFPGFGGLYYDKGGLVVVLTDTTKASTAGGPIASFLSRYDPNTIGRALADVASMRIRHGDFDWTQLAAWNRQLLHVLAYDGVTQTDIDEVRNRISIGVSDDNVGARIRAEIAALNVPTGAIIIEHIAPTRMTSDSLIGVVRPPGGGVAIHSSEGYCTLGYNAYYDDPTGTFDGKRYFITASHCTSTFGVVNGDVFGQPDDAHRIGVEVDDPYLWDHDSSSTCPTGVSCRYSDAAAIQYDDSVAWKQGYIAAPGSTSPFLIGGWTKIDAEGDSWGMYSGMSIAKVGITTGKTTGTISATCVNAKQYSPFSPPVFTGRLMLCQAQSSNLVANAGDSGAAVFHFDSALWADPLVGILWGISNPGTDTTNFTATVTFAHWYNATYELARFKGGGWFYSPLGICGGCGYSIKRPSARHTNF